MANIEKKKMEKAELEAMTGKPFTTEEAAPEKPKVVRKPRKTKIPVEVKIEADMDAVVKEETVPVSTEEPAPVKQEDLANQPSVSEKHPTFYDEDSIANKVVDMLLKKGVGIHAPQDGAQVKLKPKKPRVTKPKPAEFPSPVQTPATSTFAWL